MPPASVVTVPGTQVLPGKVGETDEVVLSHANGDGESEAEREDDDGGDGASIGKGDGEGDVESEGDGDGETEKPKENDGVKLRPCVGEGDALAESTAT